nr:MAG TPA: hypothetical protein [Caudoviricetes sp.]
MSFSVLFQRDFEVIMLLWYNIKNYKEDLAVEAEKAITINPYSLTSYYVDILFNDKKLSKFVGVYSGRIGADNETKGDAQLGRVWKPHVIQELIASNNKCLPQYKRPESE